jgi:hypothetical protein
MLASKAFSHFHRLGTIVSLASGQAHPQGIAQAIGGDVNLGAKTAATAPQGLVNGFAAFFVRLLHMGERGLPCYPIAHFPYRGPGQNTQTSLATPLLRTNVKNVCKDYSSSRKHLATVAIVPRFAVSTVRLLQSVGTFALTLSRCLCMSGETSKFSAIVHQPVVLSCGYYATNVNAT